MSVNTAALSQASFQVPPPIPTVDTSGWYATQYGCIRTDPTLIARRHTFPDAIIPRGIPDNVAPPARVIDPDNAGDGIDLQSSWSSTRIGCTDYRTAWPMPNTESWVEGENTAAMVDAERNHPQFAFRGGAPGTVYQINLESQLRRLDQQAGPCYQGVMPMDAPLFRNDVAPPPPIGVSEAVQNACNPVAALIRREGADRCRAEADRVATTLSGRWLNNPTRYDTTRFALPFAPPGIGTPVS